MLLDYDLVGERLQLVENLDALFSVYEGHALSDGRLRRAKHTHVATVAPVGMGGEDHAHASVASMSQCPLEGRDHFQRHLGAQWSTLGDEIVLHVHDDEGGSRRVDLGHRVWHLASPRRNGAIRTAGAEHERRYRIQRQPSVIYPEPRMKVHPVCLTRATRRKTHSV